MTRIFILFFSLLFLVVGCGGADQDVKKSETHVAEKGEKNTSLATIKAQSDKGDTMTNPIVKIETSQGIIELELDAKNAPLSTKNFVEYVESGFYDGTIFHRVIPNFMVQGGGMLPDMSEKKTKESIQNEANNGLKNDRGSIAMARTNAPHSASSQFFINVKDNDFLNFTSETPQGWGYAVFGKVTKGMEIIDKIVTVKTGTKGPHGDVPVEPIIMKTVTIVK